MRTPPVILAKVALVLMGACIAILTAGNFATAQSPASDPSEEAAIPSFRAFGFSDRERREPRTGPSKHRTTSGRVRRTRLVVWLIEGSSAMNHTVHMPTGLSQHKGATALSIVSKTLHARSQGLRMAFEIWRGNDVALGEIAEPVGHLGQFDSADDAEMRAVIAWLEANSWGTSQPESDRKWHGSSDLIPSLRRAVAGQPDSIIIVAGSMPVRPPARECPEDRELSDWVVSSLPEWAVFESIPPIHVLGIGLDGISGAFFERLAEATQGTVTEVGAHSKD